MIYPPYSHLLNVLDRISNEAPPEYKTYYPESGDIEVLNKARSRSFIHLFLLARFGLINFIEREKYITDGVNDAGIDGYYIDRELKKIFFIQSKFRTSQSNFEDKEIRFRELVSMDVDRVVDGCTNSLSCVEYNGKIQKLIGKIRSIEDIGRYNYEIILIANLREVSKERLYKLSGGFRVTIYNHEKCYSEFLFPVLTGSFFNPDHLFIQLNLSNKQSGTKISYTVETQAGEVDITVVFVPTVEIAKTMLKYKNSILKFNPRCYLELSESHINQEIMDSIILKKTNEFSLFNNGITMMSEGTSINERIGYKDKAQLVIQNPQILNGGQTAFSLARILEENTENAELFENKEVLLKIITVNNEGLNINQQLELIEAISNATNKQNEVTYADRHSNDRIQLIVQKELFNKYGILYERKRGEYSDAVKLGYIDADKVVTRSEILRISRTLQGDLDKKQRGKKYYEDKTFYKKHFSIDLIDDYYFGFVCFRAIRQYMEQTKIHSKVTNRILRYSPYLLLYLLSKILPKVNFTIDQIKEAIKEILSKWIEFEKFIIHQDRNLKFMINSFDRVSEKHIMKFNYHKYYRSNNAITDLKLFFLKINSISI